MVTPYRWGGVGVGGTGVSQKETQQLFEDLEVFKSHPFLPSSKLGFWGMITDTPQNAAAARTLIPIIYPQGSYQLPVLLFHQQIMGLPGLQSPSDTHVLQYFVLRTAQGTPPDRLQAETSPNATAVPSSLKLISGWPPPFPSTSVSSCLEKPEATKRIHLCSTNS